MTRSNQLPVRYPDVSINFERRGDIVTVSAAGRSPELLANRANGVAAEFATSVRQIPGVEVEIIEAATTPPPVGSPEVRFIALGVLLGILSGLVGAIVFLVAWLRRRSAAASYIVRDPYPPATMRLDPSR